MAIQASNVLINSLCITKNYNSDRLIHKLLKYNNYLPTSLGDDKITTDLGHTNDFPDTHLLERRNKPNVCRQKHYQFLQQVACTYPP